MKIVLARPCYHTHIVTPPLGIGYLASALRAKGHAVEMADGLLSGEPNTALTGRILAGKPDIVGVTALTSFFHEAADLARLLKKAGVPVVMGGVHPTFLPRETLADTACDAVVLGEGEIALPALADAGSVKTCGAAGVYGPEILAPGAGDAILFPAPRVEKLDDLPFPAWDLMPPRGFPRAPHGQFVKRFPIGVVMTSRGCPYGCTFCASSGFYRRSIRFRCPENVMEEIRLLINRFGAREIHFEDDNLTFSRRHAERLCELILSSGLKFPWACPNGIRSDKTDPALFRLMRRAGCYFVSLGIDSVDEAVLKNVKKKETLDRKIAAIEDAERAGIATQGTFIFGLPGDSPDSIERAIRFAEKSRLSRAQFYLLDVLPGSELWETLSGSFTPDWRKLSYRAPEWLPEGLTREYLLKAQARAFRRFYLKPRRILKLIAAMKPGQLRYHLRLARDYRVHRL